MTRSLNALTYKSNSEPLSYPPPIKTVGLVIASIALTAASGLVFLGIIVIAHAVFFCYKFNPVFHCLKLLNLFYNNFIRDTGCLCNADCRHDIFIIVRQSDSCRGRSAVPATGCRLYSRSYRLPYKRLCPALPNLENHTTFAVVCSPNSRR